MTRQTSTIKDINHELDPTLWPHLKVIELNESSALLNLKISPELEFFEGHFPEQAVVPGVIQIHWAGELAKRLFSCSGFSKLTRIKFNDAILPNINAMLKLDYDQAKKRVSFDYLANHTTNAHKFSSGALFFEG